jgi:hypothetical protein
MEKEMKSNKNQFTDIDVNAFISGISGADSQAEMIKSAPTDIR